MAKNNNKGFSLIEVIIAVAVFAILIVPLTSQLISAISINTTSTKKQYAVEKAEEIMESMKTVELAENVNDVISIATDKYDGDTGEGTVYDFKLTSSDDSNSQSITVDGTTYNVNYNISTYTCEDISLGEGYENYDCTVTVNNLAYAVSALGYVWDSEANDVKTDSNGNIVTTASAVGTVRNLDNSQTAVITGATYTGQNSSISGNNLDNAAYDYFLDNKIEVLKNYTVYYNQYISGSEGYFSNDKFTKKTVIKISKTISGTYLVQCGVRYVDTTGLNIIKSSYMNNSLNVYVPTTAYGTFKVKTEDGTESGTAASAENEYGIVYEQEYNELPPVYLIYVPAIYNGTYCDSDYIYVDTTELGSEEASVYIFETAADISSTYAEIIKTELGVSSLDDLVYSKANYTTSYSDVDVITGLITGSDSTKLSAYANFTTTANTVLPLTVLSTTEDISDETYLYDITVTLTDSDGNNTTIKGTRGN